ncbi:glycine cleavage system aminomethyltransferase GcvT [bacterium]
MRKTPFFEYIKQYDPFIANFCGWQMPIYISSIKDEHFAVRNNVGLFDISHMALFKIVGHKVLDFVSNLITNDVFNLLKMRALYSPICNNDGYILDDVIVFKQDDSLLYIVANAANADKVQSWLIKNNEYSLEITRPPKAALSVQGPKSADVLTDFFHNNIVKSLEYYSFAKVNIGDQHLLLSRTGYTGELGYEIWMPSSIAGDFWQFLINKNVTICGLGARDILRLESGYPLYGHELNENITPLEAGLSWTVKFEKEQFIGKDALLEQKSKGIEKTLVGIEILNRGLIPRQDSEIYIGDQKIGFITSGSYSFYLNKTICLGYVNINDYVLGREVEIIVRNRKIKGAITKKNFYYNPEMKKSLI